MERTQYYAERSCCDLDLQGSDPNLCATRRVNMVINYVKYFEIPLQITKLWAGHDFAARSCCDLELQGSDPNVASNTLSQYGDHFCKIFLKSHFK